ncbi:hypothetical protein [Actinoplanes solisilvae]|uniref:hypothetical protein n=1 Tax=Actinoplanes solisilvae TaxID=2486853 RepID=UPI000FD89B4C|nr:hypothetical protein [Actinoplanes solisilvae]
MHRTIRALLSAAAAALSASTVLVGLTAGPAQAQNYDNLPLTSWAYPDKAQPSTPKPNPEGDFLIGSSKDAAGLKHTGRGYFTFDLTPLKKQVLHRVTFYTLEESVVDCSTVAPIEVWRTKPVTSTTTWQHPPKELELLAERSYGSGALCPGAYLGVDLIPAVQAAFARGEKTITIGVRIKADAEGDAKVGRTLRQAKVSYGANHAPTVSGLKMKFPDAGCGTLDRHPTAGPGAQMFATAKDADPNDHPQITYAYWPVDHPDQRKESWYPDLDLDGLTDGTVVAWSAQAADYDDAGPWGRTCYLTVDNTAPKTAPIVLSKKYPAGGYPGTGGPGVPGTFVLDAAGDREVVGFDWISSDTGYIQRSKANHPGGRAKVTITPRHSGRGDLRVTAVDAAGNRTAWVEYEYTVRDTAPMAEFELNGVGLTSRITLYSRAEEVTAFGYTLDGGPETRLPAVDRQATGDLVFESTGQKSVAVRAYAGKKLIGSDTELVTVTDAPRITSEDFAWPASPIAGVAGTFTFSPRSLGVVAYLYDFGDGNEQRIDAGPDGNAVLTWTPTRGRNYTLTVSSVDDQGNRSQPSEETFWVIDDRPTITAYDYDAHVGGSIPVNVWSDRPNAVAIGWTFDGGPEQTSDGSYAYFDVVPTHSGDNVIKAWAKLADGTVSPTSTYAIHVSSAPQVVSRGPFGEDAVIGRPIEFTLTAVQENATAFRYTVGDDPERTVAVGPDGTATISYDVPSDRGEVTIAASSVTADGTASDPVTRSVPARSTAMGVSTYVNAVGEPGRFGFSAWDLGEATTKFLWHVNDGEVQEIAYDPWAWETSVSFTPDRAGTNTLYVQREFTDGSRSPLQTVPFEVGG